MQLPLRVLDKSWIVNKRILARLARKEHVAEQDVDDLEVTSESTQDTDVLPVSIPILNMWTQFATIAT